jgi:protein TonB
MTVYKVKAQDSTQTNQNGDTTTYIEFAKGDKEPEYSGGKRAWKKYLEHNLNTSVPFDNKAPNGIYTVIVGFTVNKDSTLSDVKALTNFGYGMEEEAVRVIENSRNWIPGILQGKVVSFYRSQPITFIVKNPK